VDPQLRQHIDELIKQGRAADRVDAGRALLFRKLVSSPEWQAYSELLSSRIQGYSDVLLAPAGSVDGAVALEFIKGAMHGMLLAQGLPGVIVEAMKDSASNSGDSDGDEE
jgi:hypothetical protein